MSALDLIDAVIADLEAKLNLAPGTSLQDKQPVVSNQLDDQKTKETKTAESDNNNDLGYQKMKETEVLPAVPKTAESSNNDIPEICKLEFKVGLITKVWVHPDADKLYCEEIEVGETEPRLIASGLRKYYSIDEMLNRKVLIVSNLKPKKLVGFLSNGMVLCATEKTSNNEESVEFIEPPDSATLGEIIFFEGLPAPSPFTAAQVEKKKVFQNCLDGMKTRDDDGVGAWYGHAFMTSKGPCKARTIKGGEMR